MFTFTRSAISSLTSFILYSNFTSSIISYHFFFLCCTSFFVGQFSFSVITFVKYNVGLLLQDKEVTQLCALLSVHELSNKCTVAGDQQTLK